MITSVPGTIVARITLAMCVDGKHEFRWYRIPVTIEYRSILSEVALSATCLHRPLAVRAVHIDSSCAGFALVY